MPTMITSQERQCLASALPAYRRLAAAARTQPAQNADGGQGKPGPRHLDWTASGYSGGMVARSGAGRRFGEPRRPRLSVAQLLASRHTQPIKSVGDLAAETFESDEELDNFLVFTYAERHRDLA